ncbi:Short-chain_dehydrogenase [Hexamita inflata]|uniref:Putative n=1 Tax=Hexamita inflata TaxID=28002 RepID=A0AA86R8A2_9EUKA|nr:Short-chain dehydrogenase [Hexamita inflata]
MNLIILLIFSILLLFKSISIIRSITSRSKTLQQAKFKTVLVTGASSGLGRELSIHLSKLGFIVHALGRNQRELDTTMTLMQPNPLHKSIQCDLNSQKDVEQIIDEYAIAFLNAGVGFQNTEATYAECALVMNTNVTAPCYLALKLKQAQVVLIASPQAKYPLPNRSLYAASKAALEHMGNCLRMDNRSVTICYPRWFESGLRKNAIGTNVNKKSQKGANKASDVALTLINDTLKGKRNSCLTTKDIIIHYIWEYFGSFAEKLIKTVLK